MSLRERPDSSRWAIIRLAACCSLLRLFAPRSAQIRGLDQRPRRRIRRQPVVRTSTPASRNASAVFSTRTW